MKNITYLSALSFCVFVLCGCNKNEPGIPEEPAPLLNRLDSVRASGFGIAPLSYYLYDTGGRFKGDAYIDGTKYTYNNEGLVSTINTQQLMSPSGVSTDIKINYQNGIPVSGKLKHYPYQNKVAQPYYETDSILYKVANGKVVEIKHIDHAEYYQLNNQLVKLVPGVKSIHTLTYEGNNLVKIQTTNAAFAKVMTYGSKKGIFSAKRLKFVLYENEDPRLSAENDLLSIVEPFNGFSPPKWEKTIYTHQYNPAGFPKSSAVSHTDALGKILNTYNLTYFYK